MDTNTTPLLQWTAPDQPHVERGHRWYVVAGTVVLGLAAYGILTNSWPLAAVSVLCGAVYFILRDHTPRTVVASVHETGILYDGTFHRFDEYAGFWILQTPDYAQLHLAYRARRKPDLKILLGTVSPEDMRLLCGSVLPELTDKKESLVDILSRLAKL